MMIEDPDCATKPSLMIDRLSLLEPLVRAKCKRAGDSIASIRVTLADDFLRHL